MTDIAPPRLNYTVVSGLVRRRHAVKRTSGGSYILQFELENTVDMQSGEDRAFAVESIIDIELWGALAEEHDSQLTAGCHVLVEGRLASVSFEDRTHTERHRVVVRARDLQILDPRNPGKEGSS